MIIVCPHCRKKHDIDEKRIPANVTMARCKGCGNRFPLQEAIEKPASPAPSAGGGARIGSSRANTKGPISARRARHVDPSSRSRRASSR